MPQVITQADVDQAAPGVTLTVDADASVTPLAAERAAARGITIARAGAGTGERDTVRAVTRAVVGRLGDAPPKVLEAVVTEVLAALGGGAAATGAFTTPRGATLLPMAGAPPSVDYCASCIEQEKARGRRRAVMTTTGRNVKGVVARVTTRIADLGGDILDIAQTLVGEYFTMIIVIDTASLSVPFERFQEDLTAACREIGCQTMLMHEDVMSSLHRV